MRVLILWLAMIGAFMERTGSAQIIPPERRTDWSLNAVGVPGGIPTRTTIFANVVQAGCDPTGANDCSTILNSLIDSCPSNSVIYFPRGRYLLTKTVNFRNRSGITWRGEGMGATVIIDGITDFAPVGLINVGVNNPGPDVPVLSGMTKNSTSITVSNAAGMNVGQMILIGQRNDTNFVWHPYNHDYNLKQMTRITSKSGNTLGIFPPLYWTFEPALAPVAHVFGSASELCGIEDMSITHTNVATRTAGRASSSIFADQTYGMWIKNVESSFAVNRHFYFLDSLRGEVRGCYVHEAQSYGPNGGPGLEFYAHTANFLVEDNIFWRCFPSIMFSEGSGGNVVAYNFSADVQTGTDLIGGDINCNHGAHTMMNLYEGNVGIQFQSDGYYGSSSHITVYRNWFSGVHPTLVYNRKAVDLCRWSRYFNVVGNVLGDPSVNNWIFNQTTNSYDYRVPVIFRLGYPNLGNNYYNSAAGAPDSRDPKVETTLFSTGNFDYGTLKTQWKDNIPVSLPPSLYLTQKPQWWGETLRWPPIVPDGNPFVSRIPAQVRFEGLNSLKAPSFFRPIP